MRGSKRWLSRGTAQERSVVSDFKKLLVWQKAHALALHSHRVALGIRRLPDASLRGQIIRAAMSIPANIVEGLVRIAPQHRAAFERNRQQFIARLDDAMGRWNKTMEQYKGSPVVVNHAMWIYLLTRFGLVQVGTVEERPGIPATPSHIVKL